VSSTRRPVWVDVTILVLAAVMFASMIALGNWQMRRLAWKLDLIESVESRAYGDPVPAPQGAAPEYLRVFARGTFAHDQSLRIKAVTDLGPGYWIMTPLAGDDRTVWVNRGFVPNGLDQPGGTLLESNQPETGRWVSADLTEMSRAAGLENAQTAYFIDAEASDADRSWPRGGLTRLTFRNTHLVYALTWYAMAALFLVAMGYVVRGRFKATD
tara:strand:- start:408 stop:1046 length:639 start_codon:yes stop_codon:yes gene_type:complete